jgi:hypothetical protein
MTERRRLPNRRTSETFTFECGPHQYTATVSYFPGTNQLAEFFSEMVAPVLTLMRRPKILRLSPA